MNSILFFLLTGLATMAFFVGVVQVLQLRRLVRQAQRKPDDPFDSVIGVLFATSHQDPKITKRQKRAVWAFSLAILLLFIGRVFVES